MGWRSPYGTFELKTDSQDVCYMAGDPVILNIRKNYRFLCTNKKVGQTVIGPWALRAAFEILHKCRGVASSETMWAIGIIAVHFPEAARIQGVLNTTCDSFCPIQGCEVATLDSNTPDGQNPNSLYVNNWDHCGEEGMERVHHLLRGLIPPPIVNPDVAKIKLTSGVEIFRQIRILPRDACDKWPFEHNKRPNPMFEGPPDDGSKGMKSPRGSPKGWSKKKTSQVEDVFIEDGGNPSYSLLDEWGPDLKDEEIAMDGIEKAKGKLKKEINGEEEQSDNEATVSGNANLTVADYLDHFPMVRRMFSFNSTTAKGLEFPKMPSLIAKPNYPCTKEPLLSYGILRPHPKQVTSFVGEMKPGFVVTPWNHPQVPRLQRRWIKACCLLTRFFGFL